MAKNKTRRLREGDFAFEPTEKPNVHEVTCSVCKENVPRKKARRQKGKWVCPDCMGSGF